MYWFISQLHGYVSDCVCVYSKHPIYLLLNTSNDHSKLAITLRLVCTWLVSTGVGVNAAWLRVTVGPSRSLAAVWS